VDVYINYLRVKIDQGSSNPVIHTVRGVGYSIASTESSAQAGLDFAAFNRPSWVRRDNLRRKTAANRNCRDVACRVSVLTAICCWAA